MYVLLAFTMTTMRPSSGGLSSATMPSSPVIRIDGKPKDSAFSARKRQLRLDRHLVNNTRIQVKVASVFNYRAFDFFQLVIVQCTLLFLYEYCTCKQLASYRPFALQSCFGHSCN